MLDHKKLTHVLYRLFMARGSGLKVKHLKRDPRNYKIGVFGWFDYKPKHSRKVIDTLSIKNQGSLNTCVYNATTVQKEVDEGKILSVRSIVTYAKRNSLLSGTGWSATDAGQKVLKAFGIMDVGYFSEDVREWNSYSNAALTQSNADNHKIGSYWEIESSDQLFKAIDEGHVMIVAMKWYTGYNMSGGFRAPWLIKGRAGYVVGGHEFVIKGYDTDYQGRQVAICQNSYGANWGEGGDFYIDLDYLMDNNYGIFANLDDIDKELAKFLIKYDGKTVKSTSSPTLWHIQKGAKKAYLHEMDYFVFNANDPMMKNFEIVDGDILDRVPKGESMDITKSPYWPILQHLQAPLNITRVLEAIKLNK